MGNWQYDLVAAKQTVKAGEFMDDPKWLNNLSLSQRYSAEIERLLALLPTMVQVENQEARKAFFNTIVQELIGLSYVQARAAQLSNQPTTDQIDKIAKMIKQIAVWLRL